MQIKFLFRICQEFFISSKPLLADGIAKIQPVGQDAMEIWLFDGKRGMHWPGQRRPS